ncbi:MAG TPA: phospholipid-binding protein [Alphaproteobacteria bacterium]|nr:phospholipid-binding protein [Alphaproteobacteria bacterium]
MRNWACAAAAVLVCLTVDAALLSAAGFLVDFTWEGTASCFDPQSPPFTLSGVPDGTKSLNFEMKDLDAPNYPHGGGTLPYSGQSEVKRGAFSYRGPCPPSGQHSYQWTIKALDDSGNALAVAHVMKKFPPR